MEDKVTKFGNIAHNLIEEVEQINIKVMAEPDPLTHIAFWSSNFLEMMEVSIKKDMRDSVEDLLKHFAMFGMIGNEFVSESPIGFNALANEMTDLYARKNRDYGNSFDRSMGKFGLVVAAIRIGDKVNRLQSLIAKRGEAEVKDENLADTFIDLACYAIMTLMWMEERVEN